MDKYIILQTGEKILVDEDIYWKFSGYLWKAIRSGERVYAYHGSYKNRLHRIIMGAGPDQDVDHISGDPLDCRRSNMRLASKSGNAQNAKIRKDNTSGLKGVYWNNSHKKWVAQIWLNGKHIHIGCFTDKIEAAKAYDEAAKSLHKEFAKLNF